MSCYPDLHDLAREHTSVQDAATLIDLYGIEWIDRQPEELTLLQVAIGVSNWALVEGLVRHPLVRLDNGESNILHWILVRDVDTENFPVDLLDYIVVGRGILLNRPAIGTMRMSPLILARGNKEFTVDRPFIRRLVELAGPEEYRKYCRPYLRGDIAGLWFERSLTDRLQAAL